MKEYLEFDRGTQRCTTDYHKQSFNSKLINVVFRRKNDGSNTKTLISRLAGLKTLSCFGSVSTFG